MTVRGAGVDISFPTPALEEHEGVLVVRDDLSLGGTKGRVFADLYRRWPEVVYACSAMSCTQVALAEIAQRLDRRATLFVGRRKVPTARTVAARALGAVVHEVAPGYLSTVKARARSYAFPHGAYFASLGFDDPRLIGIIAEAAVELRADPREVWCAAGSGVLTRALQVAWPRARHVAVQVGGDCDVGRAERVVYPTPFDRSECLPVPFPSEGHYDAKAWQVCAAEHGPDALFWNVMGSIPE